MKEFQIKKLKLVCGFRVSSSVQFSKHERTTKIVTIENTLKILFLENVCFSNAFLKCKKLIGTEKIEHNDEVDRSFIALKRKPYFCRDIGLKKILTD